MTDTTAPDDLVAASYEPMVASAREDFFNSSVVQTITSASIDPPLLDLVLINFCALGVQMTEPVDGWIRRAGAACQVKGFEDLGAALVRHADHEAGHHVMMIADTGALVELWNRSHVDTTLDAPEVLDAPISPGVKAYIDLHEGIVAGEEPYGQLAVEYEIELLSVTAGPLLMGNVARTCGEDRIASLSFLRDHIAIDEGHTVFNRRQMNTFLERYPEAAEPLAVAGASALAAYEFFLSDCLQRAQALVPSR